MRGKIGIRLIPKGDNSMSILFLQYPPCSTCKRAKKWLDEHGIDYEARNIKEQNPTAEELETWFHQSGLPLKKFFNTSGNIYKEQNLKDRLPAMSEQEQISLLATDGMLVKRPIVVGDEGVLVGFKVEEWEERLN